MTGRLLRRVHAREDGIALVLAVLILAIVSIAAASAIMYTTVGQQDAASKKSGVTAYSLAQAALSNASAQLVSHYYDSNGQPFDNATTLTAQAGYAPSVAGTQISPTDASSACVTTPGSRTTCMTWSARLDCPAGITCAGGQTITVSGTERARWHLTGIGTVPNPSGPGMITRTITVEVPVEAPPAKGPVPDVFKGVYTGKTSNSTTCDLSTGQGVIWQAPVYVRGNLCIGQNSGVEAGSQNLGKLVVGGWADLTQGSGAHVGTSTTPLASMDIAGSCDGSRTMSTSNCTLTKPAGQTYYKDSANTIYVTAHSTTPVFPPLTPIDWDNTDPTNPSPAQQRGSWSCTGGHQLSASTFNLFGSSYTCTTETGSLSWNGSTLTVNGNVYIDHDLVTSSNAQYTYTGLGAIYVGGSASFGNNTSICVGSANNHDCPNGANWSDIANNFLLILARNGITGGQSNSNFSLEGGLYSDGSINFGSGHTNIYGPIVTPQTIVPGQQSGSGFPNILDMFTGAPGTPQPYWQLGLPRDGTY